MDEIKNTEILDINVDNDVLIVLFRQPSISGIGEMEKIAETLQDLTFFHLKCWACWSISGGV
ncbi:MAG: hypothetical protein ACYTFX_10980 [Planctomycetota bacterium]